MKQFSTALFFGLLCAVPLVSDAQTTTEEYNYLTKGYKMQLDGGLDMKKGYYFMDVGTYQTNYGSYSRTTEIKLLNRESDSLACATLMIVRRTDTDFLKYVCIPQFNSSPETWRKARDDYWTAMYDWDEAAKAFSWNMAQSMSYYVEMLNEIDRRVRTLPAAHKAAFDKLFEGAEKKGK